MCTAKRLCRRAARRNGGMYVCIGHRACQNRLWEQYRAFYRLGWQAPWQRHVLLLSNTWGDRNRDARVCETFVLQEIDRAAALGLDTVQIDDGWQKGTTVNSARPLGGVWEGYYAADADFWTPHPERFPRGLYPVAEHAAARGVALGLWFSPDSSGEFANWRRDAETLLRLWRTYGVAVFKLDGVKLRTPAARAKYLSLLEMVTAQSGRRVMLQQDITAEQRMGYLAAREYGTLFVENRYTDFGNYYPHRTLRNLWMLARYVPAQRMLFELLNPARNTERYRGRPPCARTVYGRLSVCVRYGRAAAALDGALRAGGGRTRRACSRSSVCTVCTGRRCGRAMCARSGRNRMAARSQALHLQVPVGRRDISCCSVKMCRKAPSPLRGCRRRPGCACCVQTPGWAGIHARRRPVPAFCSPAHLCVLSVADIKRRPKRRTKNGRHARPAVFGRKRGTGQPALSPAAHRRGRNAEPAAESLIKRVLRGKTALYGNFGYTQLRAAQKLHCTGEPQFLHILGKALACLVLQKLCDVFF